MCVEMCQTYKRRLQKVIATGGDNIQNTNPRKPTANAARVAI